MLYRKIGNTNLNASVIGLGTWVMGGWMWGGADDKESINTIHASLDAGINLIDTAPVYGFGKSEEVVGKAIRDRRDYKDFLTMTIHEVVTSLTPSLLEDQKIILHLNPLDRKIVATKCGLRWDFEKGVLHFTSDVNGISDEEDAMKVYKYLGPESIREEVEISLKRLQTDYIDIYQTHWQDESTLIEDSIAELIKLRDEGKIVAIGASNASVDQLKQYSELQVDQEKFNMLERKAEKSGNVKYCLENNISVLAYSTMALGLLTGKITPDRKFGDGDLRKNNHWFSTENIIKVNAMLNELNEISIESNINSAQLVLAWSYNQPGITHLLCGARTMDQALSNAKAGNVALSNEQIRLIDKTYVKYFGIS